MSFLADNFEEIAKERRRIRREDGLRDDNWKTASGIDLDACAAEYEIYRADAETDYDLRKRVQHAADVTRMRFPFFNG